MSKKLYLGVALISLVVSILIIGLMIAGKLGENFTSYALLGALLAASTLSSRVYNEKKKN